MIRIALLAALPTAALAHGGGAHLHPQGPDAAWLVAVAALVGAGLLADRRRG